MTEQAKQDRCIIIGAGIGGLMAALHLSAAGREVLVLERATGPGGKLRTVPSVAGPVDAGPTVLTLLPVFEAAFAAAGERLADHLDLTRQHLLARHWWPDGSSLDLFDDVDASAQAIDAFAGSVAKAEFIAFHSATNALFRAYDRPVMRSDRIRLGAIAQATASTPAALPFLTPGRTLWRALMRRFTDHRLVQLFARYATYVGGSPFSTPALLALIWQAEARGVWTIDGGMAALARAVEAVAVKQGARFEYGCQVDRIERRDNAFSAVTVDGERIDAAQIVFNGDPAALYHGLLGDQVKAAVRKAGVTPRSLSAWVWSFAAKPAGRDLAHHNVFFNDDYKSEFEAISDGDPPMDAALYVCAQDRGAGAPAMGPERFEIIMNGAPVPADRPRPEQEFETCRKVTFGTLSQRGLSFSPLPDRPALTTPHDFAALFPGSDGSLYGRSPHGMMASFQRPTVRSRIPGLYLAGGGVHPGAGLPMAATSGRLAAEAILTDHASTSTSRRTVTRGGMSMDYPTTAATASRSSAS